MISQRCDEAVEIGIDDASLDGTRDGYTSIP